jgi:hypothetical protein
MQQFPVTRLFVSTKRDAILPPNTRRDFVEAGPRLRVAGSTQEPSAATNPRSRKRRCLRSTFGVAHSAAQSQRVYKQPLHRRRRQARRGGSSLQAVATPVVVANAFVPSKGTPYGIWHACSGAEHIASVHLNRHVLSSCLGKEEKENHRKCRIHFQQAQRPFSLAMPWKVAVIFCQRK